MIYEVIDRPRFIERFRMAGRAYQYTYEGFCALWDYLEEIYSDQGQDLELDVISLCCEFEEMTIEEFEERYQGDDSAVIARYSAEIDGKTVEMVLVGG